MKNLNNSPQIPRAWSEFVEILRVSIRDSTSRKHSESGVMELKRVFIQCLCDRDEFDQYLRTSYGENCLSSFNCPGLIDYHDVLRDDTHSVTFETYVPHSTENELGFKPFSSNIIKLINLGLNTFGRDPWGWAQIQKHYFPSLQVEQLRAKYIRSISFAGCPELETLKIKQWCPEDDFRLVSEIEKHGLSYVGLHRAFLALDERIPIGELKTRLRTLLEEQNENKRKKRTRRAKCNSVSASAVQPELPAIGIPDDGDVWAIDDSLLPSGNLQVIHE